MFTRKNKIQNIPPYKAKIANSGKSVHNRCVKSLASSHLTPRQEMMALEKQVFAENKRIINENTVVSDPKFKSYWRRYKKATSSYLVPVHIKDILKAMRESRVILFGDYHTLDQSQRSFVRFLRKYFEQYDDKKIFVALETVQARFNFYLEDFILGKLTVENFIKKIGFKEHWFFDLWKNYEVIFDFLLYHHIPMRAIDADNRKKLSLLERDDFMAREIVQMAEEFPDEKIIVLVGDLHLAPEHLPKSIQKYAKKQKIDLPILSLYQNSPEIHWQLSEKGTVDHVNFVKISDSEYCRQHTPPLIVQQSYMNWLYHEDDFFDWVDAKSSFLDILRQIAKVIKIELPEDYENVEVYTCGDLSFVEKFKRRKIFTEEELQFIERQVLHSESYFLPRTRTVYIADVSIHHAAEEATHYLKYLLSGEEFPRSKKDAFYANVLHEAVGFFGSKLINPKRKCQRFNDFLKDQKYLKTAEMVENREFRLELTELFLSHSRSVRRGNLIHSNKITNMSSEMFLAITHAIGYDLGDHLYYGFMAGKVPLDLIQHLFNDHFGEDGEPCDLFRELFEKLRAVRRPPKH